MKNKLINRILMSLVLVTLFSSVSFGQVITGISNRFGHVLYFNTPSRGKVIDVIAGMKQYNEFTTAVNASGNSADSLWFVDTVNSGAIANEDTTYGRITFTTGGADNDHMTMGNRFGVWDSNKNPAFEVDFQIRDVSGTAVFVGLVDSSDYDAVDSLAFGFTGTTLYAVSAIAEGVGLLWDPDGTTDFVRGVSIDGSTLNTAITSAEALTDGENVTVRMELDSDRRARFYVNGTSVGNTATALSANKELFFYFGVINREGSANVVELERVLIWQKR